MQTSDRIQQSLPSEIAGVIVRQADGIDPRRDQNPRRVQWRAERITFADRRRAFVGENALEIHDPVRGALQSHSNGVERIRAAFDGRADGAAEHDVASDHEIGFGKVVRRTQDIEVFGFSQREEPA